MLPGFKTMRKISSPPKIKGFKPIDGSNNESAIILLIEEYEAIRLCDYELHNHHQASVIMCVSRPTFTRIYASALRKISTAFVECREIRIEGGKVYFDSNWYHCKSCSCYFNNTENENKNIFCPLCGNNDIINHELENNI